MFDIHRTATMLTTADKRNYNAAIESNNHSNASNEWKSYDAWNIPLDRCWWKLSYSIPIFPHCDSLVKCVLVVLSPAYIPCKRTDILYHIIVSYGKKNQLTFKFIQVKSGRSPSKSTFFIMIIIFIWR